jgi:hypothetical protein
LDRNEPKPIHNLPRSWMNTWLAHVLPLRSILAIILMQRFQNQA